MFSKIKDRLTKVNKAVGIEYILLPESKCCIFLSILSTEKNSIKVEKKERLEDLEALITFLDKDTPISFVMSGRGILHKKITDQEEDKGRILQTLLPNAKLQDFHLQLISSEKTSLASIIRKEQADPILLKIKNSGHYCINFSLGGSCITPIIPLLSNLESSTSLNWSGHRLEIDSKGTCCDYKYAEGVTEKKYFQLDTEKIEDDYLVSYAAAFSILTNQDTSSSIKAIAENKEEFFNKELFKKTSWIALVFFFLLLMVNFILFSSFSSTNNELLQKEGNFGSMLAEMELLSKQVKEKETFLNEAGWLNNSSMTFFADRIAATVPASVKLTEFAIHPIDERRSKEEKKELFISGTILLRGICNRPTELNEWLEKVKTIEKIKKVKLVNYSFDDKENKGSFAIEIETKN